MNKLLFSDIVENIFDKKGFLPKLKGEMSVYYWPKVIGKELVNKVEADRYHDGFLYVRTENPALAHQIALMRYELLKKYQKILGRGIIKGIKVKIAPLSPKNNSIQENFVMDHQIKLENEVNINRCCATISDNEVAKQFSRFMKKVHLEQEKTRLQGGKACNSCGVMVAKDFNYCPSCEQKINNEIHDYVLYLKKNNQLPKDYAHNLNNLSELNEKLIKQIINSSGR